MKIYKLILLSTLLLMSCATTNHSKKITIHTIGDSTMAIKPDPDKNPERGWVQVLPSFFNDNVQIFNHAVNGRSTKSFRELGHWKPVLESLKKGDYLFIQFGHNDAKDTDPTRYTNPQTSYRYNLIRYIEEARAKGAIPILFSSIARRKFNKEGVLLDSHGNYTLIARLVAQEMKVPFFDMQYLTENLENSYGVEESKKLHLHFKPGENAFFPEGKVDDTHLSVLGATEISKIFVNELKNQKHPLEKYLK
ncbi:rhamnogalacturonan acetylesterase [Candidatus Kaistella beijingensis]|uniref:rhamnogalacturonan acetylesterase n=1 Tax=Candidatus Kaistella beijingensis TaxID=2820270 RepID=UPI001CC6117C|nr:rhamnogalacturonan acetylesterase [Candidatus Kaistella beijingensis]UBB88643.1 rhamnogalacturonan acetylesterase [Candidatus Kaistella beijingensis]